jgi:hypothetical protein
MARRILLTPPLGEGDHYNFRPEPLVDASVVELVAALPGSSTLIKYSSGAGDDAGSLLHECQKQQR